MEMDPVLRPLGILVLLLPATVAFFTLCSYNIHEGGHGIEEMFIEFFVPRCDIAIVNEANGWRHHRVEEIAGKHGFELELLQTPTKYDIGILARRSVVGMRRGAETTSGSSSRMHHGVLHCEIFPVDREDDVVHVLATHLNPHSTIRRREEARRLVAMVQRLEGEDFGRRRRAVILAGDLNTLSPLDKDDHVNLLPILLKNPRLRAKFLVPGHTLSAGEIDYMPMRILLSELVDVAVAHDKRRKPHPTVPTALHADKLHAAQMRIDYVLFNDAAAAHLLSPNGDILEVNALRDKYTEEASDHYPLVVTGLFKESGLETIDSSTTMAYAAPARPHHPGRHHRQQRIRGGGGFSEEECDSSYQQRQRDGLCHPASLPPPPPPHQKAPVVGLVTR